MIGMKQVARWFAGVVVIATTLSVHAAEDAGSASAETAATVPVYASESKSLGTPNGILEARPTAIDDTSPLGMLDPRNNDLVRVVLAMGVVVLLLLVVRAVLKRTAGGFGSGKRPAGVLQVHGRYPVGRGQHLMLIQVGPRMLLVHRGGGRMNTLAEFSGGDLADLRTRLEPGTSTFNEVLHDAELSGVNGDDVELVDLTDRSSGGWWRRMLRRHRAA